MNRIEGDCFSEDEEDGRLAEAFKGFRGCSKTLMQCILQRSLVAHGVVFGQEVCEGGE